MGETAEDVLRSTDITTDEKKSYDKVIKKFDSFFKVRKNVIFERARFNSRCQQEGETTEQFIMSLYQFVEDCEYGTLKDQMIRDRIVVGIRDKALSQHLQLDPDLTLEKAKTLTRQREAIQEQQVILDNRSTKREIDFVRRGNGPTQHGKFVKKSTSNSNPLKSQAPRKPKCNRCGGAPQFSATVSCHHCRVPSVQAERAL